MSRAPGFLWTGGPPCNALPAPRHTGTRSVNQQPENNCPLAGDTKVAGDTQVAVGGGSSGSSSLPPPTPPSLTLTSAPALVLPAPEESSGGELLTKGPPHLGFPDGASPGLGCTKGNGMRPDAQLGEPHPCPLALESQGPAHETRLAGGQEAGVGCEA